ncbi:MAG TPA: hypothetical protein VNZ52_00495 [Candidatus Thermoplasmatota archaeon]|nr:hypothetical protein [Candidatus Thermoplasmatota archaeon]
MRIIAIATILSIALMGATTLAAPVLSDIAPELSPVGEAQAKVCVIGDDDGCIIKIYCVRDCDGDDDW